MRSPKGLRNLNLLYPAYATWRNGIPVVDIYSSRANPSPVVVIPGGFGFNIPLIDGTNYAMVTNTPVGNLGTFDIDGCVSQIDEPDQRNPIKGDP